MPVVEGVHHQDVDVGRHEDEILGEGVEHVPWVEVEEGRNVVETVDGNQSDDDQTCDTRIASEETIEEGLSGLERDLLLNWCSSEGSVDEVTSQYEKIELDQAEDHEGENVGVLRALGSVTKRKDELQYEEGDVDVFDEDVDNWRGCVAKRPTMVPATRPLPGLRGTGP